MKATMLMGASILLMFGCAANEERESGAVKVQMATVPDWVEGMWAQPFPDSERRNLLFNADWSYRLIIDVGPRKRKAVGHFFTQKDVAFATPELYSIDAKSCGGSGRQTFWRMKWRNLDMLRDSDGRSYLRTRERRWWPVNPGEFTFEKP